MELESYFTVHSDDDIRLQGTRMGIETILYAYVKNQLKILGSLGKRFI